MIILIFDKNQTFTKTNINLGLMGNSMKFLMCLDYENGVELYEDDNGQLYKREVTASVDSTDNICIESTKFCKLIEGEEVSDLIDAKMQNREN